MSIVDSLPQIQASMLTRYTLFSTIIVDPGLAARTNSWGVVGVRVQIRHICGVAV